MKLMKAGYSFSIPILLVAADQIQLRIFVNRQFTNKYLAR